MSAIRFGSHQQRRVNNEEYHHGQVPAQQSGEYVDSQALSSEGMYVRYDGEGRPPVTDGPFPETKDLIAGWMVIDVDSQDRAIALAGELSAAPGAGGRPIHEWLEVRPFLTGPPDTTIDCHGHG
ncbi:hypothetical protein BH09ACT8_BH09ACT8_08160 [soil metagenome]